MELKIFYLHYNTKNSAPKDRPSWFSYENCLKNLISTIGNVGPDASIKLILVFDGSMESFKCDFSSKYFDLNPVQYADGIQREVAFISAGDGSAATRQALRLIFDRYQHKDDDMIYLLENDYMHVQGWVDQVKALLESKIPFDYLSLYDHADKYQFTSSYDGRYDALKSKLFFCNNMYWRTTPSTCFSFISKANTLHSDKFFFEKLKDRLIFPFLNFTKGRILISPMPSLSTHCMTRYLAPIVNWEHCNNLAQKKEVAHG